MWSFDTSVAHGFALRDRTVSRSWSDACRRSRCLCPGCADQLHVAAAAPRLSVGPRPWWFPPETRTLPADQTGFLLARADPVTPALSGLPAAARAAQAGKLWVARLWRLVAPKSVERHNVADWVARQWRPRRPPRPLRRALTTDEIVPWRWVPGRRAAISDASPRQSARVRWCPHRRQTGTCSC
jgi:hypothetical protein